MTNEQFKKLRISLRLTQKQMGELVGVHSRSIRRFESGEWAVSKRVQDKLKEFEQPTKGER